MSYKIIITETKDEEVTKRNYEKIGEKPDGEAKYGYVLDKVVEPVTNEVYSQSVENLYLEAIIKAINNL